MSLVDQFERGDSYYHQNNVVPDNIDQILDGYMTGGSSSIPLEEPMFALERVDYRPRGLKHMVVCSDVVIMALENSHIIRLRLEAPQDIEDIEFTKRAEESIYKLFLDPTGNNLIISMNNRDNWYLHSSWAKPKLLSKMKGIVIESVAWDMQNSDKFGTGEILIGSRDGRIFETFLEAKDKTIFSSIEGKEARYFKPVYNLGDPDMPITGLRYERFPPTASETNKFFVLVTTPTRIYQFIGGPSFENIFLAYDSNPGFQELPGDVDRSDLCFFSKYSKSLPKAFAWLTGPGIFHGNLVFGSQNPGDSVMTDTHLIPYPSDVPQSSLAPMPLSLVLTEFHFLVLYDDRFVAMSTLKNTVVTQENLGRGAAGSRMRGMAHDPVIGSIWVYAEDSVYQLVVSREDRHVWELYLDKGLFEEAAKYCKSPSQLDIVWSAQADSLFQKGNFGLAAEYYAKTQKSFEEVALKFININERDALKTFLIEKLKYLASGDATQRTALCTWITEIYLNKLNQLKNLRLEDQHEMLQDEFRQFLEDYKDNLDKETTFDLISSHGRMDELLYFAGLIEDYERVMEQHIQAGAYDKALAVMSRQNSPEIYYKYSPLLMRYAPAATVNAWIASRTPLNPRKLVPALMLYDRLRDLSGKQQNQAIRYLEYCIAKAKNTDQAIHNYLLSLYAQLPDEEPLMAFLSNEDANYDLKYALRLCSRHNKQRACVLIYSAMELYEEAVDLALKVDIELAKANADKPPDDDEELRKKLWLRIARHVVEERGDIKEAMAFLNHCTLLKIEDILPFFPDFVLIDDFKEEICSSLEDYNRHIEELKSEMDDATNSAELIRLDIKQLRSRYGFVGANQKCEICQRLVLDRQFYLFPCQHAYHANCLRKEMLKHLSSGQVKTVRDLEKKITQQQETLPEKTSVVESPATSSTGQYDAATSAYSLTEQYKNELDDLLAAECIHCGSMMIDSINKSFVGEEDEEEIKSWYL